MKRFIIKSLIFSIPIVLYCAAIVAIDPFNNFFGESILVPNSVKANTSGRINYSLWKMIAYRRDPTAYVTLGDSRMGSLDIDEIRSVSGEKYSDLALGGGTLPEMIDLFDFAVRTADERGTPLRSVLMGVNFSNFNGIVTRNRVPASRDLMKNPLMYVCNIEVLQGGYLNLMAIIEGHDLEIEKPPMSQEEFWRHQVGTGARRLYETYRFPEAGYRELTRITEYCREHDIAFAFVILPTHVDIQTRIIELGRAEDMQRYRESLAALATVYDFDYPNDLTRDKEDYRDPFHAKDRVKEIVIRETWGPPEQRRYVHIYGPGTPPPKSEAPTRP